MILRGASRPRRARPTRRGIAVLLAAVITGAAGLAAACGSDGAAPAPDVARVTAPSEAPSLGLPDAANLPPSSASAAVFRNDPALELLLTPTALGLPGRFRLVPRDDREPVLSLGFVQAAARVTYGAPTTSESLSVDLLRLAPGIDGEEFFTGFADALADNESFRGTSQVGVRRGVGERARHYAFRIEGDAADAATILRGDLVLLITYRRPPDLRETVVISEMLARMDGILVEASAPDGSARSADG